jgi:hypothetical protein
MSERRSHPMERWCAGHPDSTHHRPTRPAFGTTGVPHESPVRETAEHPMDSTRVSSVSNPVAMTGTREVTRTGGASEQSAGAPATASGRMVAA